jgi:hypothetical protein
MPLSVSHLKKNQRTVTVEYAGEYVRVTYKPSEMTTPVMADIKEAVEKNDPYFMAHLLSMLMISWDLAIDENDLTKTLPITYDDLCQLEHPFLSAVLRQITGDMFPNAKNGQQ